MLQAAYSPTGSKEQRMSADGSVDQSNSLVKSTEG